MAELLTCPRKASFMFKPTNLGKKPNNNAKAKPKPKPNFSAMHKLSSSTSATTGATSAGLGSSDAAQASGMSQKRGFEDWLANDDEEFGFYGRPRQDRNAKKFKKNKKNKNTQQQPTWSYDDIYDPSVPVNIAQYAKSEAAFQSKESWKMRLFNANKKERKRLGQTAKGAYIHMRHDIVSLLIFPVRPTAKDFGASHVNPMFAPPPDLSSFDDARPRSSDSSQYRTNDSDRGYDDLPRPSFTKPSFAPPPSLAPTPVNLNREETAEEAYARRLALSSAGAARPVAPSPPVPAQVLAPVKTATPEELEKRAKAAQQIAALKAKMAAKAAASAPASAPASASSPSPAPTPLPPSAPVPVAAASTKQTFVPATAPAQGFTQEDLDTVQAGFKQPDYPEREHSPEVTITTSSTGMPSSRGPILDESKITSGFAPTISGAPTYNYGFPGIAPHMDARIATQQSPPEQAPSVQDTPAADNAEEPSKRPGQDGFAERLLKKMGWEKGQGLGASGDGITTAIVMKADKKKRAPGSSHTPAMGKIVGGHKKKTAESTDDSPHGNMSEVIKLEGMLDNMDVEKEISEQNLLQEIGEEMGQYGKVERVFIWRAHMGGKEEVFVQFTSQLSALRAVKGMDETEFAGNVVRGRFWDAGKFERGEYA